MLKKCVITISGQVQGVSFRYYAQEKARELGLAGFTRNEKGGTVRIESEGDEGAIRQLIAWCKNGPTHAQVDDVACEWSDGRGEYRDFVIKR